ETRVPIRSIPLPTHSASAHGGTRTRAAAAASAARERVPRREPDRCARARLFRMLRDVDRARSTRMELLIIVIILAAVVFWAIAIYNRLVGLRNRVRNAFAQIDVQLTRRYDLIPNLVEAVKGYMGHERGTLEAVINARNAASTQLKQAAIDPSDPNAIRALGEAEATLAGTLGRLFALAEAYPDLKANQNMLHLQEELASTENKVAFARQAFNDSVMTYNTACESFPSNLVAKNFDFKTAEFLE